MPSSYTTNSGIEKPGDGEQSGTWGQTVNDNMEIIDRLTMGVGTISLTGYGSALPYTLITSDGTLSEGQYTALVFAGSPSGALTVNVSPNDAQHVYVIKNNSGVALTIAQGSGSTVAVPNGKSAMVYCTGAGAGAAVVDVSATFSLTGTLQSANNLSDVSNVATARTNLGLAIGTNVLAFDSNLQSFVNTFTLPTTDGTASQVLGTNGSGTLSFITVSGGGGGTVTSVDVSGGTTGLTTSGGPIVGSGTITIAGTLAVANGGTGSTTSSGARTNLGLGTISTQNSNSVSVTGGSITGITDLAIADGGTGASDAATARTNLGLAIGTNVQAYDSDLAAVAGLASTGIISRTGSGTAATRTLTAGTGISISNGDGVSGNPTISSTTTGTVTSITAGSGLTGGTITGSGTIAISSSYAPNSLATASGSAPSYSARSWVNFGGATPTIAASGNVSSITDIATGRFGVNFTTAMPNSNYATTGAGRRLDAVNDCNFSLNQGGATYSTSRVDVAFTDSSNGVLLDPSIGCVVTFV